MQSFPPWTEQRGRGHCVTHVFQLANFKIKITSALLLSTPGVQEIALATVRLTSGEKKIPFVSIPTRGDGGKGSSVLNG